MGGTKYVFMVMYMKNGKTETKKLELRELKENEFLEIGRVGNYAVVVGRAVKNNKTSYQLRLSNGLSTIAKIRTLEDLNAIKTLVAKIDKINNVIQEIDSLNKAQRKTKTTSGLNLLE